MTGPLLLAFALGGIIGLIIGQRSPAVCIVGTCAARATRCEGHR